MSKWLHDTGCPDYRPVLITDAAMQAVSVLLQQVTVRNVENRFSRTLKSKEYPSTLKEFCDPE
jgi:hypothetical protein